MWAVRNPRPVQPTNRFLVGLAIVPSQGRCQISAFGSPNPTEALIFGEKGNAEAAARLSGGEVVPLGNEEAKE